jgi:hypothetical protein
VTTGSISLGDVAARARYLDVACSRCERRGRYALARLVANLGADFPMTSLASHLADCPRRAAAHGQRCDVFYPGLGKLMDGDAR